jgi:hypothetical protein
MSGKGEITDNGDMMITSEHYNVAHSDQAELIGKTLTYLKSNNHVGLYGDEEGLVYAVLPDTVGYRVVLDKDAVISEQDCVRFPNRAALTLKPYRHYFGKPFLEGGDEGDYLEVLAAFDNISKTWFVKS